MSREQPKKTVRCAIYTRKSTDENLDMEFNSLDAQRESGEAYIASQKHEGWICLPEHYDDGGYTGGNMDRPALKRLMADVAAGKVDCIVVYKVDRLSRAILDFARIVEVLDKHNVSFVSVTQQFNTTTSMDRPRPTQWHKKPDLLVWRDAVHWHAYWKAGPHAPRETFAGIQRRLALHYGTDPCITDLPRVMRLPGFLHRKATPTLVRYEAA